MEIETLYIPGYYCGTCDKVFSSEQMRTAHLFGNLAHPSCNKCNRWFPDKHALRTHWSLSHEHNFCCPCNTHFKSAAGLAAHREFSSAHRSRYDSTLPVIDETVNDWEETFGREFFPHENNLAKFISETEGPVDEEVIWFEDFEPDFDEEEEIYQRTRPKEPVQEPPAEKDYITSCSICCGPLADQVSATKCGHVFCTSCIKRSLEHRKACPVCNCTSSPQNLRSLYLF